MLSRPHRPLLPAAIGKRLPALPALLALLAIVPILSLAMPAVADPTAAAPAAAASSPATRAAPAAETVLVIEDEAVRIKETRVRGQTVRVHVQSKIAGVKGYEIIVNPGRDPAQLRGATGQHAWSLFRF